MKQFAYKALDKDGKAASGIIESLGVKQAARALQDRGLLVVSLVEKVGWGKRILAAFKIGNKVSDKDIALFTRLLSTMMATGLPLVDALSNLVNQFSGYFRDVIRGVQNDVQSGVAMSEAMGRYPEVFDNLYVNLVKAGEASGKVSEVLEKQADSLESAIEFKGKVQGAMIYPVIIVTAMLGIAIFMLTTIIPQIAKVYADFHVDLPLPTRILIGTSTVLSKYFPVVLILFILLFVFYRILRNNKTSDYLFNNALYKMPIFGKLREEITLAILNRTLGTLLGAGVAIIDSLAIVAATMSNDHFRFAVENVEKFVEKGLPLSVAIRRNPVFPVMMVQLTAIGEETGTMDQSLLRIAKFYEESSERRVKVVTTAMEPLMILLMGVGVGGFAVAVLLPMFNLVNVIK